MLVVDVFKVVAKTLLCINPHVNLVIGRLINVTERGWTDCSNVTYVA